MTNSLKNTISLLPFDSESKKKKWKDSFHLAETKFFKYLRPFDYSNGFKKIVNETISFLLNQNIR